MPVLQPIAQARVHSSLGHRRST